ncbi:hypothetical protein GQ457_06G015690 [Hibiscus cannabinus]
MPPRMDKFPSEGLEGAPSKDIGWHFGDPVPNARGHVICKFCGKVTKRGITRFKEHIAHKGGEVSSCPNVIGILYKINSVTKSDFVNYIYLITSIIRESMMKLLQETKDKKLYKRKRTDEFLTQLRGEEDDKFFDDVSAMRQATRESIQSQHGIEGRNSDEVQVVGEMFMKKDDLLLMDRLEDIVEKDPSPTNLNLI